MEENKKLEKETLNGWDQLKEEKEAAFAFSEGYKTFLNKSKTERQSVETILAEAKEKGYQPLSTYVERGSVQTGDKIYAAFKNKQVILFEVGKEPIEKGMLFIGSHLDAPRLDLKQAPLYEDGKLSFFKTHYYGGIKKYHWVTTPLSIIGTIVKENGEKIEVSIGEDEEDPVFSITDLLPHLSKDMMAKKVGEAIEGEMLNILVGSIPHEDKEAKERFKKNILTLLNEKYGIVEEDFYSAELEMVPAGKARDVGLDRSLIGAYGQDDRVCAYTSMRAVLDAKEPSKSIAGVFVDKEEIGSVGDTSMSSKFFENTIYEILHLTDADNIELAFRRGMQNSKFLSADVNAASDPNYPSTHDKYNAAYLGEGLVLTKYTGSRGKSGSNDAHAEFMAEIRGVFNRNNVVWQSGELGKVDMGGGGTIAFIPATFGMDVVDCGVGLLSMHAPFEIASKSDVYMLYKGYKAFYEDLK